ncbi:unnamed protein product, partial [marine sediment metagenome]
LAEFGSDEWTEPPPGKFVKGGKRIIRPHRQRFASTCFAEFSEKLREKYSALDEQGCREVLGQIGGVTERTGVKPDAKLMEQTEPVEAWLRELEAARDEDGAFHSLCDLLEEAIDEGKDRQTLEKLAAAILRFDRGMPELLAARYNSRMEELKREARRKFAVRLTGVVLGLILLAAGVTAVVLWQMREQKLARWHRQLSAALEKDDLTAAEKLLGGIAEEEALYTSPEIQRLLAQYQQKMKAEEVRRSSFGVAMEAVSEAGVESPSTSALDR